MKKTTIILLVLIFSSFKGISQTSPEDSTAALNEFYSTMSLLGPPPVRTPPESNDLHLRGMLFKIFEDEKIWKDFITDFNNKTRHIFAPETDYYYEQTGPEYCKHNLKYRYAEGIIMIDSSVSNYYNNKIKGFQFDSFKYRIIHFSDGTTVTEDYSFFKEGKEIRAFTVNWNETQLVSIQDWNISERE